uniref:Uncharacterized protein n=1 Tax=Arundo donax TaxID=35708 RepID=A0A0A8ZES9_ARUDO
MLSCRASRCIIYACMHGASQLSIYIYTSTIYVRTYNILVGAYLYCHGCTLSLIVFLLSNVALRS